MWQQKARSSAQEFAVFDEKITVVVVLMEVSWIPRGFPERRKSAPDASRFYHGPLKGSLRICGVKRSEQWAAL